MLKAELVHYIHQIHTKTGSTPLGKVNLVWCLFKARNKVSLRTLEYSWSTIGIRTCLYLKVTSKELWMGSIVEKERGLNVNSAESAVNTRTTKIVPTRR